MMYIYHRHLFLNLSALQPSKLKIHLLCKIEHIMKQQASNPVPTLTPNDRRHNKPQTSDRGKQRKKGTGFGWDGSSSTQVSTATSQVPLSPVVEDGFTVVSRSKPPLNARSTHNRPLKHDAVTTPRSAAAASRARVYAGSAANKPPSQYKQSCLPVEERDPALLEAERYKGIKLPKESFKPGTIIRAVLHEPDFQGASGASNVTDGDKFRTNSVHGPIYTKTRKMIVLATFKDNYIAIPLYTHNGRGLQGKLNPEEFVSVQDHRATGPFTPLSMHRPLVTEHLNPGIDLFHEKTAVHITYPVSRKYSLPVVQEGRLNNESVRILATLFSKYISPFLEF